MSTVYTLSDPQTNEIRYVGHTRQSLAARMAGHRRDCRQVDRSSPRDLWLRNLLTQHIKPEITVLETIPDKEDWNTSERFWISYLKFLGCRLTNQDSGGFRGYARSANTRARLSRTHTGKKMSDVAREKMSLAKLGIRRGPHSAKHRERIRQAKLLYWQNAKKLSPTDTQTNQTPSS